MNKHLLNRRQFSARCAAFGLSIPTAMLAVQATAQSARRAVKLPDGTTVTALGQGGWKLGQGRHGGEDSQVGGVYPPTPRRITGVNTGRETTQVPGARAMHRR
jgi:hypothetical protein